MGPECETNAYMEPNKQKYIDCVYKASILNVAETISIAIIIFIILIIITHFNNFSKTSITIAIISIIAITGIACIAQAFSNYSSNTDWIIASRDIARATNKNDDYFDVYDKAKDSDWKSGRDIIWKLEDTEHKMAIAQQTADAASKQAMGMSTLGMSQMGQLGLGAAKYFESPK